MATRTGSAYFAEALAEYGVDHVFFVPAVLMQALAEMDGRGIRRIMAHTEKSAAYMADGYARASGRPAVCMAQNIGASNLAAGLRDPRMAGSPVIALTGGPTAGARYRNFYQEIEDITQFDPVTKFNARIDDVSRLPDLLRQAFRAATTGTPGPVHLEVPGASGELFQREAEFDDGVQPAFARVPAFRPAPAAEEIAAAAAAIRRAERPVIVAGGGVVWSGAQAEVVALAELLRIPVATTLNAKGTIADTHELSAGVVGTYSRECANRIVAAADLVIFVGSRTGSQVTTRWQVPARQAAVVQIDIEPSEIGRNYARTTPVCGDAKMALQMLVAALPSDPLPARDGWLAAARQWIEDWRARETPLMTSDAVPIRPERLCRAIANVLPADGVVVADTGHSGMWSSTMIDFTRPGQRYIRCAGSLGWSLPASIGVKCALPDRPVICFNGDGAIYYHISELETAARHGIPIVVVVNHNAAFNQEIHLVVDGYGGKMPASGEELWRLGKVDFAAVAESFGCYGQSVTEPGDIEPALERALASGRPALVSVATDVTAMARFAWQPKA